MQNVEKKEETASFSNSPAGYTVFALSAMVTLCICVVCCRLYCISSDEKYMDGIGNNGDDDDIFGINRKTFDDLTDIMAERYAQHEYSQHFYSNRQGDSHNSRGNGGMMMGSTGQSQNFHISSR